MESSRTWMDKLGRIGVVFLLSLLVIVGYLVYHAGRFHGITNVEALDQAQIARNLAQGEGYTTKIIRPLSLAKVRRIDGHPELSQAPLHPFMASLLMRVMPDKGRAAALSGGLAFLLTAPVIFFLGWQLFDIRTGVFATILYCTNVTLLRFSISCLEVPWLTLLTALLFLVCFALARKQRWRPLLAVLAGSLVALLYLTQYVWIVILPVLAVYVFASSDKQGRWGVVLAFLISFLVIASPWFIRNMKVTGRPFFSFKATEAVMGTRSNPGNTLYRQYTEDYPTWIWYVFDRPLEIIEKARDGLSREYIVLGRIAGLYLTPFFLVAIIVTLGARAFERLRYLWYAMYLVLALALALVSPSERLLIPMAPLVIVVAAGFFLRLLEARIGGPGGPLQKRYLNAGMAILVLIHAVPLGFDLFRFREMSAEERSAANSARAVAQVTSMASGPIVTDVPWLIAWYADSPAVWLPKTRGDLRNMEDSMGKVTWMLLSPQVANRQYDRLERMLQEWGVAWRDAMVGDVTFEGYSVAKRVVGGQWVLFRANPKAPEPPPLPTSGARSQSPPPGTTPTPPEGAAATPTE